MDRENLKYMAEKQVVWVPILFAMKICSTYCGQTNRDVDRHVVEKTVEHHLKQVSQARKLGVRIAIGTDAGSNGVLHGKSYVEEMHLLLKAGLSLPETVKCATFNGAQKITEDRGRSRLYCTRNGCQLSGHQRCPRPITLKFIIFQNNISPGHSVQVEAAAEIIALPLFHEQDLLATPSGKLFLKYQENYLF
jgi:Amidohydrolase family